MSKLDDAIQSTFVSQPPDETGEAWGIDTTIDYFGGKEDIVNVFLSLLNQSKDKMAPLTWLEKRIKEL